MFGVHHGAIPNETSWTAVLIYKAGIAMYLHAHVQVHQIASRQTQYCYENYCSDTIAITTYYVTTISASTSPSSCAAILHTILHSAALPHYAAHHTTFLRNLISICIGPHSTNSICMYKQSISSISIALWQTMICDKSDKWYPLFSLWATNNCLSSSWEVNTNAVGESAHPNSRGTQNLQGEHKNIEF